MSEGVCAQQCFSALFTQRIFTHVKFVASGSFNSLFNSRMYFQNFNISDLNAQRLQICLIQAPAVLHNSPSEPETAY